MHVNMYILYHTTNAFQTQTRRSHTHEAHEAHARSARMHAHALVGEARLRDQVVDERGEAGELRVAESVVPKGEAHDAWCFLCVLVW